MHLLIDGTDPKMVDMQLDRRLMLGAGLGLGATLGASLSAPTAAAQSRPSQHDKTRGQPASKVALAVDLGLAPDSGRDETDRLQAAIDRAAERRVPLSLQAGRYIIRELKLRSGTTLAGVAGATILQHVGGPAAITADQCARVSLDGLVIKGAFALDGATRALIDLRQVTRLALRDLDVEASAANGIMLERCSGTVTGCRISGAAQAGLFSLDSAGGMEISHNHVADCGNNGILVWRTAKGEDGSVVALNRVERIAARAGGSGQNGNGINVYRAGGVLVTSNRIIDCAFSAVRANSASDVQIISNSAARMAEVALYAEFAFEGAVIASNLVDGAATGISVTNFNEGGRLATITANLVRNLVRRKGEPDTSGIGIAVEADAAVTGNTIEGAANAGLMIGWGRYCRDVAATGNMIRGCGIGVAVTGDPRAGAVLIASNLISGSRTGAIRAMDHGQPMGGDLAVHAEAGSRIRVHGNAVA